jgi:hypothetical protein
MMHIDGIQELLAIDGYAIKVDTNSTVNMTNKTFSHEDLKALG